MITPKKKRTDLAAPETVQEQWKKGTLARDEMAELLVASNFRKDLSFVFGAKSCSVKTHTCTPFLLF